MPRYEFKEGSSNKFWEISLEGTSFSTKYGKIGTDGQETIKEWDDEDKAKKEYDKLIAEKTKKGYKLVSGGGSAAAAPAPAKAAKKPVFDDEGTTKRKRRRRSRPQRAVAEAAVVTVTSSSSKAPRRSSGRFWLEGSSFTTKYGRLGTDGQETMKEFDSADKAKKEYDKLVAEKTKKGYVEK